MIALITKYIYLLLILTLGLVIRIALNDITYSRDAQSFVIWARFLSENPIYKLYEDLPGDYLPYPPTYYYILKPIGFILDFPNNNNWSSLLIAKTPVLFSEIVAVLLIFKITQRWISKKHALHASAFFYLNPALIYNTSVWGQIDSIVITLSLLFVYLFLQNKYFASFLIYMVNVTVKLQGLALLPMVAVLALSRINIKDLIRYFIVLLIAGFLIFLPIISRKGIIWTSKYLYSLVHQYPYTSIYAYNLWSPRGFIRSDKDLFLSLIEYRYVAVILFWIISLIVIYPLARKKSKAQKLIIFGSLILFFNFYFFSTRIHSRYLIYSLGFMAPFFMEYPKASIALTVLVIANLLLPFSGSHSIQSTKFLESNFFLTFFTLYGLLFFLWLISTYRKLLTDKGIKL